MRNVSLGQPVIDQFPVYANDGYTKVSGETAFTVRIWKNAVPSAIASTVTEIGTSGEYKITFTPDSAGDWACTILANYNKSIWYGEYAVAKKDIEFTASMAEDGSTARFTVWGEDQAGRAAWLTGMTAEIRDSTGGLIASLGVGIGPTADGTFLFNCAASVLAYNTPYYLRIVATSGTITWNGNCGFVRVD